MSSRDLVVAAAGASAPSDPYFENVSMLLTGDGTNGAQNNTFLDSSTNNFTITRNGNTTQGTFSPYGNLWSNYFDGSGDYLSFTGTNAAFQFGTGAFTIETWVMFPTGTTVLNWLDFRGTSSNGAYPTISTTAAAKFAYVANAAVQITGTTTIVAGVWYNVAVSRTGTSTRLFVNGVQEGSTYTDSTNYIVAAGRPYIGGDGFGNNSTFNGYISNCRIVKGTAVYTSNFTPSTTPLTAVSGTSLLTCQSNRFIDNSSNNFTLTVNGNTSVQRFSPFNPTAPYSTATIGGSGYFDGTGDYLSVSAATALNQSGDFTVEGWINLLATPPDTTPFYGFEVTNYLKFGIKGATRKLVVDQAGVAEKVVGTTDLDLNTWNHVAFVRSGTATNNCKIYLNGVFQGQFTNTTNVTVSGTGRICSRVDMTVYLTCYLSDLRVTNTAVYTTNFTPPTAPLTAISGTSLLCNMTNAGIPDAAMMNDLETVGNAQVSTSVKKYGTGSLAFDGTGDYLTSNPATTDLYAFGSGNFTIEGWVYLNATQTSFIYDSRPTTTNGAYPCIFIQSNAVTYYVNTATAITGATLSNSTWYHIALCRSGTSTKLFVNGTQSGSTYTDSNVYLNSALRPVIGGAGYTLGTSNFNGYIDDLRITKGYARYTANFTPPAQALPTN